MSPLQVSFELDRQRIFVTGGHGFIGTAVVSQLSQAGARVCAPPRAKVNVCDREAVWAAVEQYQPDAIVHLAGVVGGRKWLARHDAQISTETCAMTNAIVHAAEHTCVQRVLGIGSTASYADDAPRPLCETTLHEGAIPRTIEAYANGKRELGMALAGMSTAAAGYVLPCNVYGPGQRTDGDRANVVGALVSKFVDAVNRDASVVQCYGAHASREFLFVDDCAAGIVDTLRRVETATPINLGTGIAVSIPELTQHIAELADYRGSIVWVDEDAPADALWSSDAYARSQLAWRPSVSLQDGLRRTVQWYQSQASAS